MSSLAIVPGDRRQLNVALSRKVQGPAELELLLAPELGGTRHKLTIADQGSFPLRIPNELDVKFGTTLTSRLKYRLHQTTGELEIPFYMAGMLIPPAPPKYPQFTLNSMKNVVNLAEHDPNSIHLLWKSWQDLSVRVYLWYENGLQLRVDVLDNKHVTDARAPGKGDSVRVACQIPGQPVSELLVASVNGSVVELGAKAQSRIEQKDQKRSYLIPLKLSRDILRNGVRFNLLVNDNDGDGLKGWMQVAPGLGKTIDPRQWPLLKMK